MAACSAKTKFPGFSINNVELGQCFNSTRSEKETVYKLVAFIFFEKTLSFDSSLSAVALWADRFGLKIRVMMCWPSPFP